MTLSLEEQLRDLEDMMDKIRKRLEGPNHPLVENSHLERYKRISRTHEELLNIFNR